MVALQLEAPATTKADCLAFARALVEELGPPSRLSVDALGTVYVWRGRTRALRIQATSFKNHECSGTFAARGSDEWKSIVEPKRPGE